LSIHVRFIETFESLLDNRRALCEQPLLVGAFSLRRDLVHLCGRFAKLEGRMHERVLVWNLGYELFRKLGLKKYEISSFLERKEETPNQLNQEPLHILDVHRTTRSD
jgi:hypothetical protein